MSIRDRSHCVVCHDEPAVECVCFDCAAALIRHRLTEQASSTTTTHRGWRGWAEREPGLG
jgi:hypothetical protein